MPFSSPEKFPRSTESLGEFAALEIHLVGAHSGNPRFPGQEHVAGNSKIPSIMYYDQNGELKAAGAEAENASTVALAEDENWTKAELCVPTISYCSPTSSAHMRAGSSCVYDQSR